MADITNRSAYEVNVPRHPKLKRKFAFSRAGRTQIAAYLAELRAQGLNPQVTQGDDSWQVRVRRTGHATQFKTFASLGEAQALVNQIEAEQERGLFRDYTAAANVGFAQLIERYIAEECPRHKGGDTYTIILRAMLEDSTHELEKRMRLREAEIRATGVAVTKLKANRVPMGNLEWLQLSLTEIRATDIEDFIHERMQYVEGATVDRQLDLLQAVIKVATQTWGYHLDVNPMQGVRRPKYFNERDRRLSQDEEVRLVEMARKEDHLRSFELRVESLVRPVLEEARALDTHYARNNASKGAYDEVRRAVLRDGFTHIPFYEAFLQFQLGSAARRGEALGLTWDRIDAPAQTAFLPHTKNGRSRKLALRSDVLALLERVPRTSNLVFDIGIKDLANTWRRLCDGAGIEDLRIHDLRHEAISRAAESGVFPTVLDLQAFSGHRDIRSLARYTHLCTTGIAKKLEDAESRRMENHRGRQRLRSSEMSLWLSNAALQPADEAVEVPQPQPERIEAQRASNVIALVPHRRG